ncbi:molybdopterin converting factor subunit 1 [Thalassotalea ponticola]|uniref:molybdopterin converting factor subunit 1 n=1 Tax=Thalassotalea ponticola TaxID=1523392 RepID=UPI0025B5A052|nr:molybdopterin converting factor subunit 1 [Thalassotalea ponticola]MDN3651899.1 molybdopterin converting factor subunit 1 [Thalassotalea ponticola]
MINILFFAAVRETLNCSQLALELPKDNATLADLKRSLASRQGKWQQVFTDKLLMCAVNEVMVSDDNTPIKTGDTIAFFPPVTGG